MNDMKADKAGVENDGAGASRERDVTEVYETPLEATKRGRLVFVSGAQGLYIAAGAAPEALLEAQFRREAPRIWRRDGVVMVRYKRAPLLEQLVNRRPPPSDFLLNDTIPWELEFNSGVSQLRADLSRLQLRSLDILGGASKIRLRLAAPGEAAFIYIAGGVSGGVIQAHSDTAIRVRIGGGASRLTFAGQRFGAVGGETSLQSANFETAASRYDICIAGGASDLRIGP